MHLYNSTSTTQRRVVFGLDRAGIRQIAVDAARSSAIAPQDSPKRMDVPVFAGELHWNRARLRQGSLRRRARRLATHTGAQAIINLPATVEMATPNIYADQIEWMSRNLARRDSLVLSLHPHNDRGCGVAAAELGVMAGAERIEGCLFGNGERTGNVCLVTLGLNLHTQGIDPGIDFSDIGEVIRTVEYCNQLPVHPRHPYGGELVFTAFSGSHQDAIKKGLAARAVDLARWQRDLGCPVPANRSRRSWPYVRGRHPCQQPIGQGRHCLSARAGHGLTLPRLLQIEFSQVIQAITDASGKELSSARFMRHSNASTWPRRRQ
jgi:2-isopropylmalate synthase